MSPPPFFIKTLIGLWGIISFIILIIIGILVFLALSKNVYLKTDDGKETSYYKKLGMIHYLHSDNVFSLIYSPVYGADAKTFKPISGGFGKDKKYIYYCQTRQPQVDYQTFEITEDGVYRDKNHEYKIKYDHLTPIITQYKWFETFIEDNRHKIKIGEENNNEDGFKDVEKQISFKLPNSYKWFSQKYGFIEIHSKQNIEFVKYIPSDHHDYNERDILVMYKNNRKNRNFPKNYLSILENHNETYFLFMETGIKENEYKIYKMNNLTGVITPYADDFLRFLVIKINNSDGYINWKIK